MTAPARTTRGRARHHRPRRCPSCDYTPAQGIEADEHWNDLEVEWFVDDPNDQVAVRRFCSHCQPQGTVAALACRVCGDGPMLTGPWAASVTAGQLPPAIVAQLTDGGWRPARDGNGWVCCG
jgi:hypothetical protein